MLGIRQVFLCFLSCLIQNQHFLNCFAPEMQQTEESCAFLWSRHTAVWQNKKCANLPACCIIRLLCSILYCLCKILFCIVYIIPHIVPNFNKFSIYASEIYNLLIITTSCSILTNLMLFLLYMFCLKFLHSCALFLDVV